MKLDANRILNQAERSLLGAFGGRSQSETSFLQRLLLELNADLSGIQLSPAALYHAVLQNRSFMQKARDVLDILAEPSRPLGDLIREGDWLLRANPGTGDVGHISVLASSALRTAAELAAEGIATESTQPGYYALVIEGGAFPHSRSRPFARRVLDSRRRVPPNTLVLRPTYSELDGPMDFPPDEPETDELQEDLSYEQIVQHIRQELNLPFTDPDDPGLITRRRRLRELFTTVPAARTKELHNRLGTRPTSDDLSKLFHRQLAPATQGELLKILEDRFPVAAPAPTAPTPSPTTATKPCKRPMASMGQLLKWERSFLAMIHDRSEDDFKVGILIGPIIIQPFIQWPMDAIIKMALKKNDAITIDNNIWFPYAIDTSTIKHLAWLAHESVHVVDYQIAGVEAFLKTYYQQAIVNGFQHDKIPHERRAIRMQKAVLKMLPRFPDLVKAIGSCDGTTIQSLIQLHRETYRNALAESMEVEEWIDPDSIVEDTPVPGRIHDFMRDLLKLPSTDTSGFKKVIETCFVPKAPACKKTDVPSKKDPCSYAAFIVGEWSHDRKGEQDVALDMIDHLGSLFPKGAFTLREETTSTADGSQGPGILTDATGTAATTAVTTKRGIPIVGLPGDDQFRSEHWVPGLIMGGDKLITFTGSAHTAKEYLDLFKKALPRTFNMSPGKAILNSVRAADRRGLVLLVNMADEVLAGFEEQAYREKLHEFPNPTTFDSWLTVFKSDWTALFSSIKATTIYKLAQDVYWALVPPYSGLRFDQVVKIAWSDAKVSDMIRKDKSWTLYDIWNNRVRFEDDNKKGKHFWEIEVDVKGNKIVGAPKEQNF